MSLIVKTVARLLAPLLLLFGAYIVIHGHLTPGGGFPGGVIIAAAIVLLILAYGVEAVIKRAPAFRFELLESVGALGIALLGILGVISGAAFLQNIFPLGELGRLFSGGGLPLLYISVGVKVMAGITLICFAMLFAFWREEREH
jgi:multicomponent Na+:H+ antiporter subunit B